MWCDALLGTFARTAGLSLFLSRCVRFAKRSFGDLMEHMRRKQERMKFGIVRRTDEHKVLVRIKDQKL